jgi:hypothetical protein
MFSSCFTISTFFISHLTILQSLNLKAVQLIIALNFEPIITRPRHIKTTDNVTKHRHMDIIMYLSGVEEI